MVGLGLGGAVAINLVAGAAITGWLLVSGAELSGRGRAVLFILVLFLVGLSSAGTAPSSIMVERARPPFPGAAARPFSREHRVQHLRRAPRPGTEEVYWCERHYQAIGCQDEFFTDLRALGPPEDMDRIRLIIWLDV